MQDKDWGDDFRICGQQRNPQSNVPVGSGFSLGLELEPAQQLEEAHLFPGTDN